MFLISLPAFISNLQEKELKFCYFNIIQLSSNGNIIQIIIMRKRSLKVLKIQQIII